MKELLKFNSFNFVGNSRKNAISSVAHAVGSTNDQNMMTSGNEVENCVSEANVVLRYSKYVILGFMMLLMSFNVNGQSCANNVSACLISGKTYVCIGEANMTKNISDYFGNELLGATAAKITPQYVVIKGEIVVDKPYYFSNASHIIFDVSHNLEHPLVVNSSLDILGTVIQGCTDSWDKILVNLGGHLTIGGASEVYDAYTTAIHPMPGSSLTLTATTFEKCNRAIDVVDGSFVHWIAYNTFEGGTTMNLSPGGKPMLAISGNNAGLISMEYCYFNDYCEETAVIMNKTSSNIKKCIFSDCCKSIESVNGENGAFATIYECTFNDGKSDVKISTDALLTENVFQNTEILCIEIVNSDDRTIDIIDDNVLEFQSGAIYYHSTTNGTVNIKNNSLTGMTNFNYSEPIIIRTQYKKTGATIHHNQMEFNSPEFIIGIAVYESGIGTVITDNIVDITNSTWGVESENNVVLLDGTQNSLISSGNVFTGNGLGAGIISRSIQNLKIGCTNSFNNFEYGNTFGASGFGCKIRENNYLDNDKAIDIRGNLGYVGKQVHHFNCWEGGITSPMIDISQSSFSFIDPTKNQFIVSSDDDCYWPDPVSDSKLRTLQQGNYPSPCSTIDPPGFPQFGSPFPGDGFEWSFDYYRFGFLEDNPSLLITDSTALLFYQVHVSGPIGLLYDYEQEWLNLHTMDPLTQVQYEALITKRDWHFDSLALISNSWYMDSTGAETVKYHTWNLELEGIQQSLNSIDSLNKAKWLSDASALLTSVSSVVVPNVPEQNFKKLQKVVLENYINGSGEWSSLHLIELITLASQCTADGGRAVYIARSLLGGTWSYDDNVICNTSEPLSTQELKNKSQFNSYPNPSTGQVIFTWNDEFMADELLVYDVMGNLLYVDSIKKDNYKLGVDLSDLVNGVYMVKLLKNNKTLSSVKLVIAK